MWIVGHGRRPRKQLIDIGRAGCGAPLRHRRQIRVTALRAEHRSDELVGWNVSPASSRTRGSRARAHLRSSRRRSRAFWHGGKRDNGRRRPWVPAGAGGTTTLFGAASAYYTARPCLLHAQRDEPQLAVGVRDQQQHRFLAVLFQLVDALLDVGGVGDRLLRHLDDDLAGAEALVGGV